jgi:hypothetical protein
MNITQRPTRAEDYSFLLKQIADELFHQEGGDRLSAAVTELYSICSSVTGIDGNSEHAADLYETTLPNGKALSPGDAARCMLDYSRTSKFLRGIYAAILEAQKRFPDTAIEILYAGCGPFAPLAIPLTSRFSPDELRLTLLDIHQQSLDAAQRIFQAFGLTSFVRDYIQGDAAYYRHEAPHAIHIVVVEAMQAALEKEPQVAITANLAQQLCPRGIFIPERIAVDGYLCDLTKEFTVFPVETYAADSLPAGSGRGKSGVKLGGILELTARSCRKLSGHAGGDEPLEASLFPKVTLDIPNDLDGEFYLMLLTTITIFDSVVLRGYESGLTHPKILFDLGKIRGGMRIELAYHLGERPGFKYRSL